MDILLGLVIPALGTALIIGVVWLAFGRRDALIPDAAKARARLGEDWPRFAIADLALSIDGRVAIAREDGGGRLGVVFAFGDKLPTRLVAGAEIVDVRRDGRRLAVVTRDFGHPRFVVEFAGEAEAIAWQQAVAALSARAVAA